MLSRVISSSFAGGKIVWEGVYHKHGVSASEEVGRLWSIDLVIRLVAGRSAGVGLGARGP